MTDTITSKLSSLKLRNSAAPAIKEATRDGDHAAFAKCFNKLTAKARKRFEKVFSEIPLTAGWSEHLATEKDEVLRGTIAGWCDGLNSIDDVVAVVVTEFEAQESISPYRGIVSVELLLRYGKQFQPDQLVTVVCGLAAFDLTASAPLPEDPAIADTVRSLTVTAELPFALGLLLEPLQISRTLSGTGIKNAAKVLDSGTDTDGTLQATIARHVDEWLAPFVRIASWAQAFKTDWATNKTRQRFQDTIERVAQLVLPDGLISQPRLSDFQDFPESRASEILAQAAAVAGFSNSDNVGALLTLSGRKQKKSERKAADAIRISDQSDWGEVALLRRGLKSDSDAIFVDWEGDLPNINIAGLGTKILGGCWDSQILVDGKSHTAAGSWVCTCWFEDKEVAFAELEAGSEDGVRHVRHVMLSLTDHYALITESATCPDKDAKVEMTGKLPIAAGAEVETNTITRDLRIEREFLSARLVPAWLADDRIQSTAGDCRKEDHQLVMSAQGIGGVTMPLLIDWHPERDHRDADWSALTVTEDRRVVTSREAAGYRMRVGNLQLLAFRSLRPGDDFRAVLGLHTDNESVYGRVQKNGSIAPLVLVESHC